MEDTLYYYFATKGGGWKRQFTFVEKPTHQRRVAGRTHKYCPKRNESGRPRFGPSLFLQSFRLGGQVSEVCDGLGGGEKREDIRKRR